MSNYWQQIRRFNEMYKLPNPELPTNFSNEELLNFKSILQEELDEVSDIEVLTYPLDRLTAMSDWLGDIVVYCSTHAYRLGLPLQDILSIIMESNFSKLGEDGKPIYDHRGKVEKGPNYWKPEPKIRELLSNPKIQHFILGRLSNEASQDSEGHPVYMFLDETKEGYDAWVSLKRGDHLKVKDPEGNVVFDSVIQGKVNEYTLDRHEPQLEAKWFNLRYKATLLKKV